MQTKRNGYYATTAGEGKVASAKREGMAIITVWPASVLGAGVRPTVCLLQEIGASVLVGQ